MIVFGAKHYRKQGQALAQALHCSYEEISVHRFPDGESKVTLPTMLTEHIILCQTLDRPNNKLIELFLTCTALRERGVQRITLVAPYLCYMRQDAEFHPGEIVTQTIIGKWLGDLVDTVITVDPHLHRVKHLSDAIPNTQTITLSAAPLMAEFLTTRPIPPLLMGPDEESQQWVQSIAEQANLDWAIARKVRRGDHQVKIQLPEINFKGRRVVLIDDVASTGRTLANTAKLLKNSGADMVKCFITHPLFADDAEQALTNACITHIWSSDSISHSSNVISLTKMIAKEITEQVDPGPLHRQ